MSFNTGVIVEAVPVSTTVEVPTRTMVLGPGIAATSVMLPARQHPYVLLLAGATTAEQAVTIHQVITTAAHTETTTISGGCCPGTVVSSAITETQPYSPCGTVVTLSQARTFLALPAGVAFELVSNAAAGVLIVLAEEYTGSAPLPEAYYPCCPCLNATSLVELLASVVSDVSVSATYTSVSPPPGAATGRKFTVTIENHGPETADSVLVQITPPPSLGAVAFAVLSYSGGAVPVDTVTYTTLSTGGARVSLPVNGKLAVMATFGDPVSLPNEAFVATAAVELPQIDLATANNNTTVSAGF